MLGRTDIPVTVVALDNIVRGEFAENTVRKDFTLSEAVAIKQALEPVEKAAAKTRMLAGKPSGKLPKGRAGDKAAKATGRLGARSKKPRLWLPPPRPNRRSSASSRR